MAEQVNLIYDKYVPQKYRYHIAMGILWHFKNTLRLHIHQGYLILQGYLKIIY